MAAWTRVVAVEVERRVFFAFLKIFILFIHYLFRLRQVLVATLGIFVAACGLLSCSMHVGSNSPTGVQTQAPCIRSAESYPLDHQGRPWREGF